MSLRAKLLLGYMVFIVAPVLPRALDGSERAFRLRTTPMRNEEGRLLGAVTLLEDITRLREIDRLKSEFIATASQPVAGVTPHLDQASDVEQVQEV